MPWAARDAKRFKKGLSPKQARQWAAVANSTLRACEDKGGKDCEKRAIMAANGVTGEPKAKTIAVDPHRLDLVVEKDVEETEEDTKSMSYVPYGIASFHELEMAEQAQEKTHEVSELVDQLHMLMSNVISDPQVDTQTGISQLLSEFTQRVEAIMSEKQVMKEAEAAEEMEQMISSEKSAIKRENGIDFPRGDFAYVPDPSLPSTWKLRLTESPGKVTVAQLGRAAAALSAGGFRGQKAQIPSAALAAVKRRIRSEYRKLKVPENNIPASVKEAFSIWKEKDSDRYRFMAIYSNNFRDDDNPAEIISAKSHTNFVEMVDEGIVDFPELWHYHVPGTAWGKADMVDFADGFAIASGYIYEGHEAEAEAIAGKEDIRMSHGMPVSMIVRNQDDPTIIDFHVTREISDLPGWAAANKLTDFVVMTKEIEMPLSDAKKKYLMDLGLGEQKIADLESALQTAGKAATEAGIESKDVEQTPPPVETPVVEEETKKEEAPETTLEPVIENTGVSRDEIAQAIASVITPLIDSMRDLSERLGGMEAEMKELKVGNAQALVEIKETTPALSLSELIAQNVIGKDASRVDGRTKLAKDGPKETEDNKAITGVDVIDRHIRNAQR